MNYASFDLETTGLNPCHHQILEAAFVIDGEDYYHLPLSKLPWNSMLVVESGYYCSPFVNMMHTQNGLWADIECAREHVEGGREFNIGVDKPARGSAIDALRGLFAQMGSILGNKITLAGKNIASLDMRFLIEHDIIDSTLAFTKDYSGGINPCKGMRIDHRTLDVGPMYFRRGLDNIPDTKMCCELAGIPTMNSNHRAYGDCIQVAALIRHKVLGKLSQEDLDYLVTLSEVK